MRNWVPAILGTLLAFIAIALVFIDSFWSAIGLSESQMRGPATISFSLVVVAVGFFWTILKVLERHSGQFRSFQLGLADFLSSNLPQLRTFGIYDTHEANEKFLERIKCKSIKSALNTRVFTKATASSHFVAEKFHRGLRFAIQNGLRFKEVASASRWEECKRLESHLKKPKGLYEAGLLETCIPLLNFIVLTAPNDEKEVWFGWPIGPGTSGEALTVITSEPRVVQIFERWHQELFAAADDHVIVGAPTRDK